MGEPAILDDRPYRNTVEYLVKWEGFGPNGLRWPDSWLVQSALSKTAAELLADYKRHKKKGTPQQVKKTVKKPAHRGAKAVGRAPRKAKAKAVQPAKRRMPTRTPETDEDSSGSDSEEDAAQLDDNLLVGMA